MLGRTRLDFVTRRPWKCYHRFMYIPLSSGEPMPNLNLPFRWIPKRFEVVFCLEWECCTFKKKIHSNPTILDGFKLIIYYVHILLDKTSHQERFSHLSSCHFNANCLFKTEFSCIIYAFLPGMKVTNQACLSIQVIYVVMLGTQYSKDKCKQYIYNKLFFFMHSKFTCFLNKCLTMNLLFSPLHIYHFHIQEHKN